jgi:hypothetical protein
MRGKNALHIYVIKQTKGGWFILRIEKGNASQVETVRSEMLQAATLLYCILKVLGSNFDWNTDYPGKIKAFLVTGREGQ